MKNAGKVLSIAGTVLSAVVIISFEFGTLKAQSDQDRQNIEGNTAAISAVESEVMQMKVDNGKITERLSGMADDIARILEHVERDGDE
ncbi:MAG: hypothetical protein AAGH15_27935 [Myxococcota bacterium]